MLASLIIILAAFPLAVPIVIAAEPTGGDHSERFLLEYPAPKLSEATFRIIETQEKVSITTLQNKLLITVEKGVIKSVTVLQSTGSKPADDEMIHWIETKWHFRPGVTGKFTLPLSVQLPKPKEPGPPLKASKSDLATLQDPQANKLIVTINVDRGRITNISVARSTGNPKLDNAAIQWVKNNWVFSPDKTGSFQLPVVFRKGG